MRCSKCKGRGWIPVFDSDKANAGMIGKPCECLKVKAIETLTNPFLSFIAKGTIDEIISGKIPKFSQSAIKTFGVLFTKLRAGIKPTPLLLFGPHIRLVKAKIYIIGQGIGFTSDFGSVSMFDLVSAYFQSQREFSAKIQHRILFVHMGDECPNNGAGLAIEAILSEYQRSSMYPIFLSQSAGKDALISKYPEECSGIFNQFVDRVL